MFFKRDLSEVLIAYAKFPVIALLGPRQAGKTTLVKHLFKQHQFISLESPEMRELALTDPKRFLRIHENPHGIIIDEFQYAPQLLSYIQLQADEQARPGYFVLTGSQNFLMNQAITQSLAGRVGILTLLPMDQHELVESNFKQDIDAAIFNGGYPRLYAEKFEPQELHPSYIQSYIERDIRLLVNVGNLRTFQLFMRLCAGRVGQLLNLTDLAVNCGITRKTAAEWLSILEASYIIFLLQPHFNNFNKRLIKTPKLYFYDTGLACSLLGLRSKDDLSLNPFRGHLFECLVIADLYKQYYNLGIRPPLYFWRDQSGRIEVDCLIDKGSALIPIEVKSGETIVSDYFESLTKWNEMAGADPSRGYVIYGGDHKQQRSKGNVIGWQFSGDLVATLEK